jgi:tRNA threonylcarbamoyladenosine biosynthesis protein TsaE
MEKTFELKQIKEIARDLLKEIKKEGSGKATILALFGDLGAGKTTITKEIAGILGVKENVISPTFVIMKKYQTTDSRFKNLIHIDAYRLDEHKDILVLGWEEMINDKDNLIIVEWPEKIESYLPKGIYNVSLNHKDDTSRTIKFWYN